MRFPDFIIIGAQKCGTTSLFHYLSQHPDINLPDEKEIHFFDKFYHRGINWYLEQFPADGMLTGEATPYYIYHPHVAERIAAHCPDVKLILMLRNPADRAYSNFFMEKQRKQEPLSTFEEAIDAEPQRILLEKKILEKNPDHSCISYQRYSYLERGRYYYQIKKWLNYFLLKEFLFIKSEDFFNETERVMRSVFDFLRIRDVKIPDLPILRQNHYPPMRIETRNRLKQLFLEDNQKLSELLGDEFNW